MALGPPLPPPAVALWGAWARRACLRAGLLGCSALLLLWAAIFLYGSFYYSSVPGPALLRPLHLTFRSDCGSPGPELCSFPRANVSLLGPNRERVLLYGQLYRISLELELPESPLNRALGMFMVNLTCYGPAGRPLASAARAVMLHYRSPLLRTLHTVAFAGLFLAGFAEQKQTLEVELCPQYREDPYLPTAGAVLEIQSKRVQLYGARLRVSAHFSGLRYLLYHFPVTSALLGVAGNFTFLLLLLLAGHLRCRRPAPPRPGHALPRPGPATPRPGHAPQAGTTRVEEEEEEAPPASSDGPENLGASEAEAAPPPLPDAEEPPREGGEGRRGEGRATSPAPPPPGDAPPSPTPRPRHVCASS